MAAPLSCRSARVRNRSRRAGGISGRGYGVLPAPEAGIVPTFVAIPGPFPKSLPFMRPGVAASAPGRAGITHMRRPTRGRATTPGRHLGSSTLHPNGFGHFYAAPRVLTQLRADYHIVGHNLDLLSPLDFDLRSPTSNARTRGRVCFLSPEHARDRRGTPGLLQVLRDTPRGQHERQARQTCVAWSAVIKSRPIGCGTMLLGSAIYLWASSGSATPAATCRCWSTGCSATFTAARKTKRHDE